ncbi:flavin reductase [Aquabacter sp. CN5-332]|uniref:flavin reductase n=1 Tax=Aquabacter sp. CN5-332 TaxID=3156608 RepID=UPI0032B48387
MSGAAILHDGDPSADPHAFRRCLGQFATGITVVTSRMGEESVGLTVNSFASVSLDPPLVLWSIDRKSRSFAHFEASGRFTINVLAADQIALSRHFGRSGPDKFKDVAWSEGAHGVPVLDGVAAVFECHREAAHAAGDHLILIGRVERAMLMDRSVLLFAQGRYRIAGDHPDEVAADESAAAGSSAVLAALFRANHRLSADFSRFREDLTRDQHRVLIGIEKNPGLRFEALVEETFLGAQATQDALSGLVSGGAVAVAADGALTLTPKGRERRRMLNANLAEMESTLLAGIPPGVLNAGRQLLSKLAEG